MAGRSAATRTQRRRRRRRRAVVRWLTAVTVLAVFLWREPVAEVWGGLRGTPSGDIPSPPESQAAHRQAPPRLSRTAVRAGLRLRDAEMQRSREVFEGEAGDRGRAVDLDPSGANGRRAFDEKLLPRLPRPGDPPPGLPDLDLD